MYRTREWNEMAVSQWNSIVGLSKSCLESINSKMTSLIDEMR